MSLTFAGGLFAGETGTTTVPTATAPGDTGVPVGPLPRAPFDDPVAGYSLILPSGYVRLTETETHAIFEGLSQFWGKDFSERAQKRPPAWFKGPIDPKNPKNPPPMLAIGSADLDQPIAAGEIDAYKEKLEDEYKRQGNKYGEIDIKTVTVDGITSLQVEHDIFSRINNERTRLLRVAVPAKGRWYDLSFNFTGDQSEGVHAALKEVVATFKVAEHPTNPVLETKWSRVLWYTVGFGAVGLVLGLLLKRLSAVK